MIRTDQTPIEKKMDSIMRIFVILFILSMSVKIIKYGMERYVPSSHSIADHPVTQVWPSDHHVTGEVPKTGVVNDAYPTSLHKLAEMIVKPPLKRQDTLFQSISGYHPVDGAQQR